MSRSSAAQLADSFQALPVLGAAGTAFTCTLCGSRFTHGGRVCGACPISNGCDLIKCPDCGFQFPRSSRIAKGISSLWNRWRKIHEP